MLIVRITEYDWGTLRIVTRGISFSCVIHPEHAELIAALECGDTVEFTDEQNTRWQVDLDGEDLIFKSCNYAMTVKREKLKLD